MENFTGKCFSSVKYVHKNAQVSSAAVTGNKFPQRIEDGTENLGLGSSIVWARKNTKSPEDELVDVDGDCDGQVAPSFLESIPQSGDSTTTRWLKVSPKEMGCESQLSYNVSTFQTEASRKQSTAENLSNPLISNLSAIQEGTQGGALKVNMSTSKKNENKSESQDIVFALATSTPKALVLGSQPAFEILKTNFSYNSQETEPTKGHALSVEKKKTKQGIWINHKSAKSIIPSLRTKHHALNTTSEPQTLHSVPQSQQNLQPCSREARDATEEALESFFASSDEKLLEVSKRTPVLGSLPQGYIVEWANHRCDLCGGGPSLEGGEWYAICCGNPSKLCECGEKGRNLYVRRGGRKICLSGFVHRMCAIWSGSCYFGDASKPWTIFNLRKDVTRGLGLLCSFCRQRGATLGCRVESCQRSYHYPCALIGRLRMAEGCCIPVGCRQHFHVKEETKTAPKSNEAPLELSETGVQSPAKGILFGSNGRQRSAERAAESYSREETKNSPPLQLSLVSSSSSDKSETKSRQKKALGASQEISTEEAPGQVRKRLRSDGPQPLAIQKKTKSAAGKDGEARELRRREGKTESVTSPVKGSVKGPVKISVKIPVSPLVQSSLNRSSSQGPVKLSIIGPTRAPVKDAVKDPVKDSVPVALHLGSNLLCSDLSRGLEKVPVPVTNDVDDEPAPDITYLVENVYSGCHPRLSWIPAPACSGCPENPQHLDRPTLRVSLHAVLSLQIHGSKNDGNREEKDKRNGGIEEGLEEGDGSVGGTVKRSGNGNERANVGVSGRGDLNGDGNGTLKTLKTLKTGNGNGNEEGSSWRRSSVSGGNLSVKFRRTDWRVTWQGESMWGRCAYDGQERLQFEQPYNIVECTASCPCWGRCANSPFQKGLSRQLEVFKTVDKGWGVRTLQRIHRGQFVVPFFGEVLSNAEAKRRGEHQDKMRLSCLFEIDSPGVSESEVLVVDGYRKSNVARFINHSCEGNLAVFRVYTDTLEARYGNLAMFAVKDIEAGTELSYDYRYQTVDSTATRSRDARSIKCFCRSSKCRVWLWVNPQ